MSVPISFTPRFFFQGNAYSRKKTAGGIITDSSWYTLLNQKKTLKIHYFTFHLLPDVEQITNFPTLGFLLQETKWKQQQLSQRVAVQLIWNIIVHGPSVIENCSLFYPKPPSVSLHPMCQMDQSLRSKSTNLNVDSNLIASFFFQTRCVHSCSLNPSQADAAHFPPNCSSPKNYLEKLS